MMGLYLRMTVSEGCSYQPWKGHEERLGVTEMFYKSVRAVVT